MAIALLVSALAVFASIRGFFHWLEVRRWNQYESARLPNLPAAHQHAWKGDVEALEAHLRAGGSCDQSVWITVSDDDDTEYWTPLRAAAATGRSKIAERLIAAGADPCPPLQAEWGNDLLSIDALVRGHDELALYFASQCDLDQTNFHGETLLSMAVVFGNRSVVERLLADGADVSIIDVQGRTIAAKAVSWKRFEILTLLAQHGAALEVGNVQRGETLMDLAAQNGSTKELQRVLDKYVGAAK